MADTGNTLKIDNARFILTVDTDRRIVRDGSILVRDGRIAEVGKASDMEAVRADRVIDASDMVITPGMLNGHAHISYAHATRGIFPDTLGPDYLPNVFRLQSELDEEAEYCASLLAIVEMLKGGTTCFMDPGSTKYLDACMDAYEQSGCRIIIGTHVTDKPNPVNLPQYETAEAISVMENTIRDYDHRLNDRVRAWAMPFDASYSTDEMLVAAKRLADEYGTGLTLHQTNGSDVVEECIRTYGMRPIEYLDSLGILGENVLLSHVIGVDDAEMDVMARTGATTVMCPSQTLKQATGITKVGKLPELLERGIPVGLGTDAPNNSNLMETMRAMYLAAVIYKDGRQDMSMIPPETALELATIGGAAAFSMADDIGSIEVGKKADLVLFDTRRPEWRTLFNPINNLVYSADGRSVHTVIVDGRVVVEDYKPTFVDEWELIQRLQAIGEEVLAKTGISFASKWPVV